MGTIYFVKKHAAALIVFVVVLTLALVSWIRYDPVVVKATDVLPKEGPIISFNFDDGFLSAYKNGIPLLDKAGFKSTNYIITKSLGTKGYMTSLDVLNLQSGGHEIGAHTRHHVSLGKINNINQIKDEVYGSKQDLFEMGVKDVSTFAYPEGSFDNSTVEVVKESGFIGARTTKPLLNDKTINPFLLRRQRVQSDTSFVEIKNSIDEAIKKKKWLILSFHRIDEGGVENVSHEFLQQIIDYVKEKKVPVVTNEQGLKIVGSIP